MLNTKFTAESIKNHFHYKKWIYVLIIAAGYFATDLAYTMTEYRPSDEHKVDFQLVQGGIVNTDGMSEVAEEALSEVVKIDPTLEQVEFIQLAYSGNSQEDIYGVQKYVVMLAANEGDVWILSETLLTDLYLEGAVLPLDGYIESGVLNVSEAETDKFRLFAPTGETDENDAYIVPTEGEKHVYACPASLMPGLKLYGFDPEGKCAVIMKYSKNPETSARVLDSVIKQLSEEE